MNMREIVVLVPVVFFIIWIGVYPKTFLKPMEATVSGLLARIEQKLEEGGSQQFVERRVSESATVITTENQMMQEKVE
jgi:hypothetical protein